MKRVPATFFPPITIDHGKTIPMYRQLYDWFRRAILDGQLRPGRRVPSSRSLAAELKISRIPVLNAYEQLHAEGYLETFVGAGTCVAQSIPDDALKPPAAQARKGSGQAAERKGPRRISRRGTALMKAPALPWANSLGAFRVSLPALDHFPFRTWSKLVVRHSRKPLKTAMAYGDAMGYMPLREAIADYLRAVRAVRCEPSQILVTTGSQQGLQLCANVLLNAHDRVWMEDPGYRGARQAFLAAGARLVAVPVDQEGLNVAEASAAAATRALCTLRPRTNIPWA